MQKFKIAKFEKYAPIIYSVLGVFLVLSVILVENSSTKEVYKEKKDNDYIYVEKKDDNKENQPVIKEEITIIKPVIESTVEIKKFFYSIKDDKERQINSIVLYKNTYMQNSGINYASDKEFDVISILDGKVINVKEDPLLGKIIEIRHTNNIISVYQSLSKINFQKNDEIKQGEIIGKSGKNEINKNLKYQLNFELYNRGEIVNPLNYFDKKLSEI